MEDAQCSVHTSLFAAEALLGQLDALWRERDGVRAAEDIEYVHRMRVASRRLRGTLSIFAPCLPRKRAEGWTRAVRRITRALGAARDTDVQLDWLQHVDTTATPRAHAGIARVVLRLRQARVKLQARVLTALDRMEADGVLTAMSDYLRGLVVEAHLSGGDPGDPSVQAFAARTIAQRLNELLAYEPYVSCPDCLTELHAMRIAAKHLRYTMQLFAPLFPDALRKPLQAARTAQDLLGEIHDCDVWAEELPRLQERERRRAQAFYGHARPFARLLPGFTFLREDRQAQRARTYDAFAAFWSTSTRTWTALAAQMRACLPPEPGAEGAA
jgi:CHAD domain-containing protein